MRLRVTSIDPSMTKDKLVELFEEIGDVDSIKIFRTLDNSAVAMALIEMKRDREGEAAVKELNGFMIGTTRLRVEFSQDLVRSTGTKPKPPVLDDDDEEEEEGEEDWKENDNAKPDDADLDDELGMDDEEEEDDDEPEEIPLDELDEEI